MPCCCQPNGLTYLRALLERRHDIAVHPAGALEREVPPPDLYFYRPGEVLVPVEEVDIFLHAARRLGIRAWPVDGCPSEHGGPEGDRDDDGERDRSGAGRAPVRFVVGASADLDTVLDRLARAGDGRLKVTPNHVLFACPRWQLSPDGEPQVAPVPPGPGAQPSWDLAVAVVDSGLPEEYTANPLLSGVTVGPDDEEAYPYRAAAPVLQTPQGHGSFVAGVVRMEAPEAQVRSYMALDDDGVTDEWFLGRQVGLALASAPAVLNLSLGAPTRHDESLLGLGPLQEAATAGGGPIVVAAAGNLATTRPFWPAAETWVIGVGAVELVGDGRTPVPAAFTNSGPWVDACALGVDVVSAYEAHPFRAADGTVRVFAGGARWSGTSFAAPKVAAAVATLLDADPTLALPSVLHHLQAAGTAVAGLGTFVA